ncbi:polyamine ABC transporter ATP-binding protein [Paucibacter aquatile]|uniref:Polyamine ABC transporter ATP-binding protein n=1 Tax=Kinneretia aquatilis TaxID=2070761 RepID=A0A2N8KU43_9BURK|nr:MULTISPECIES: ATP-binding cassette domain-containing protein [Roseateles]PND36981.1 polyamine ABC transporter ATP-binding protein [Paucibacter aquatile]
MDAQPQQALPVPLPSPLLRAEDLTLAVPGRVLQQGISFELQRGEILVLMGGSGCGKSTLLRHLIGLQTPAAGRVLYGEQDLAEADDDTMAQLRRQFGVMFQGGALWSSMTVGENVMLPLTEFSELDEDAAEQMARFKLALVGMEAAFDELPSALSGGMKKRAAIARAMALDPPLLFLDEPSAGLDPLSAASLDELILNLRDHLGTSIVLVTHELSSIFAVADRALFLDAKEKTMTALDAPRRLLETGPEAVRLFLRRGVTSGSGGLA